MAQAFKDTLNLPETSFPMRASLAQREPDRVKRWAEAGLYGQIQAKNTQGPTFVLHDGPPFTNGDVHIGTALNKTLKDITLRYKSMRGYRTPYVPGWDCHGLPIEQKVAKELQAKKQVVSTAEQRELCDRFSENWIEIQRRQFQRLGILADWDAEYKTKAPVFEAAILRTFAAMVEEGLVYRSKKPVYWSIPFETALAEAEIEYKEHISPAIWVKFSVPSDEATKFGLPSDKPLFVVIWTTTPWTLPANLAIAVHPDVEYAVVEHEGSYLLLASPLVEATAKAMKLEAGLPVKFTTQGKALERLQARHPFIDRASPIVLADYVTTDSGTGCVHTAPGHGQDDYLTGLKYGLEIYCPVGDDGCFVDDGQVPADLVGLTTLETKGRSPANVAVIEKLKATNTLLAFQRYEHQYPHCWRSKTPIIFRAVDQWFVGLDKPMTDGTSARDKAKDAIGAVSWVPAFGEKRIRGAVESRPDWCVSRQRSWGVPIPAFYDQQKNAYLDAGVAKAVAEKIAQYGSNYWFSNTAATILEGVELPSGWPSASELTCGKDTLDVWIDSGSSHMAVLRQGQGSTQWPADLYLEGSDQHRGWFQSSLWTGVIAAGGAPYKAVLTHGFIVGEDGKKISKSGQYEKPPTSDNFVAEYGADVIRSWIASQNFTEDITLSKNILNSASEAYRSIRNTLRFQLANLSDFTFASHAVELAALLPLDAWVLHQTNILIAEVTAAFEAYEYHRAHQLLVRFCTVTLSATYHTLVKDRLYTLKSDSFERRSAQTAIYHTFQALVKLLAPVLTFTADEAWSHFQGKGDLDGTSIHLESWPQPVADLSSDERVVAVSKLLALVPQANEKLEELRKAKAIGRSLDAELDVSSSANDEHTPLFEQYAQHLPELFGVSAVRLSAADDGVRFAAKHADGVNCPRCWRWVPKFTDTPLGACCARCADALS